MIAAAPRDHSHGVRAIHPPARVAERTAISGAAMDQRLPKRHRNYIAWAAGSALLAAIVTVFLQMVPRGLQVDADQLRVATVERGLFRNDLVVRSTAEPLRTTLLDAIESGRVEEVLVNDGALVEKGDLLFRLSNPQLRLALAAREADHAQQISNLSLLRVSIETSVSEHQRRLLDLRFALADAERRHNRFISLMTAGVISIAAFEESRDRLKQQRQALENETARNAIELRIKSDGVRQMEQAVRQLDAGMTVVSDAIEALAVRAPISGRLTDFHLQLGEIVKAEQRVGRIDDPSLVKLTAQIDEYFLGGVVSGKRGSVTVNGRTYPIEVSRVFPQIKGGRFGAELLFVGEAPPEMNPGQSADARLTLGASSSGLLLPNDAFLSDTGGTWVFVLSPDGRAAVRRPIRVGRRNTSQVEVAAGLSPGERVIASTYAGFGAATRLQITR